jgi:uncharacterized protein (TIGR02452 family)
MNRERRVALALETDEIVAAGRYRVGEHEVSIATAVAEAVRATHLHLPDDPQLAPSPTSGLAGRVEVTGETTLEAVRRLVAEADDPVACLNFASAKHPGGGYRSGSQAQEESIARSSGLVACLESVPEYYAFHRQQGDACYSDRIICSPGVPVFRDDGGDLLAAPHLTTVVTAAAPNAGALRDHGRRVDLRGVLAGRARLVLAAAAAHGDRRLVLGAWGCGVFRNDPAVVADVFADLLAGAFRSAFDRVTFAVFDPTPATPTLAAFERRFA